MRRGDAALGYGNGNMAAQALQRLVRGKVALPAANGLGVSAACSHQGGHVYLATEERDAQACGQLFHEPGVGVGRFPADHMVHMQDCRLPNLAAFVQLGHRISQRG